MQAVGFWIETFTESPETSARAELRRLAVPVSFIEEKMGTLLMATLVTPDLLLLDEHTAALDPKTALKVLELSQKIVEEHQITTLMITHNMEDALKYGNKTMIMKDGQIIAMIEGKEREEMTVEGLIHLYSTSSQEYTDRVLLK